VTDGVRALLVGDEVRDALSEGRAVVALESAVLTHGLPSPRHLEALRAMDGAVRESGAVPAVCLTHAGSMWVGASAALAEQVAADSLREKVSVRDLGRAIALGISGGLTVSATLHAAFLAGVETFATGGVGGVHVGAAASGDVSADLQQLARTPLVIVCSGAKSVLDIPLTLEYLETAGVSVYAYGTDRFPAFYLTDSGQHATRVRTPREIAAIAQAGWTVGHEAAVLVGNPIPSDAAIGPKEWTAWLHIATEAATRDGISGKAVTPYLLAAVAEASGGRTVDANIALLRSNARLAGEIAVALAS
jgi:pseudouridine-5'-phosphate glycosidase